MGSPLGEFTYFPKLCVSGSFIKQQMNEHSNPAKPSQMLNTEPTGRLSCILHLFKYHDKLWKQTCQNPWMLAIMYSWDKFLFLSDVISIQLAYILRLASSWPCQCFAGHTYHLQWRNWYWIKSIEGESFFRVNQALRFLITVPALPYSHLTLCVAMTQAGNYLMSDVTKITAH